MRIDISRIFAQLFYNYMGHSRSHNLGDNNDYWLISTKRTVYNIPIGEKYFYFKMNMHMLRLIYK